MEPRTTVVPERNAERAGEPGRRPAVAIRGLSHRYANVEAIRSLTLSVPPAQFVALIGPNGSGKTTLLEILSTLLVPTRGDVAVAGFDVRTQAHEVRHLVAFCPSGNSSFWPRLTGFENLQFFAAFGPATKTDKTPADRLREIANEVGLDRGVLDRQVRTYSDGQAQRLNLARAFLRQAAIWLIDEPTRSLDPEGQRAMWSLIRDRAAARGATVIAATHDVAGVAEIADVTVALA